MTIRTILAIAATAALAVATQAGAQAYISDGIATGQSATEYMQFGDKHLVMDTHVTFAKFVMADETHPMNELKGECFGAIEIRGGAAEGNGVCVLNGLTGDRVLLGWQARRQDANGAVSGYWTVNAGAGRWLQASGGGTFVLTVNRANGAVANTLKGAVTLR